MSWNQVTDADVLAEFTAAEAATLKGIQGAADALPGIVGQAVAAARSAIRAGGNQLDRAGTVPDEAVVHVISQARWRWLRSFPQMKVYQTDGRRDAAKEADEFFIRVKKGEKVEPPDPATALTLAAPVNSVATPRPGRHIRPGSFDKMSES